MFNIESNWGRAAVTEMSEVIINKNKPPHDALIAGMFTHTGTDIHFGGHYQRTLFEYTLAAYVNRICQKSGIKSIGSRIINVPLKGTNVYEHSFESKDKKVFWCYQYGFCPTNPFDHLTLSILERGVTKGCRNCNYKGFTDDDIECFNCRNGAVRNLILNNPEYKTFRSHSWEIFKDLIGEEETNVLEKFRDHYIKFHTDDFLYKQEFSPVMREYVESDNFGDYFEVDLERDLLMLYRDDEPEGSTDGDDESEDQTQDD